MIFHQSCKTMGKISPDRWAKRILLIYSLIWDVLLLLHFMIIIFLARFAMSMHLKEILLFILVCFIVILRFRIFLVLIRFEIQLWKLRFFVKCCFPFVRGVLRWGFGGGRGSLFVWVLVLWAGLLLFGNFVFLGLFGFVGLVFIRFIKD